MIDHLGHKNNTIIMGPGGYRFGHYWRMGLPLEILVVVVSVTAILYFWPLWFAQFRINLSGQAVLSAGPGKVPC